MATEAQIAANRRNAQHSTGPKTEEGKERSRGNALRHGLSARHPVALGEDEAEFLRYWESFAKSLQPQNAVEAALVRRAALCGWRLERLYFIEAALFDQKSRREARIENDGEEMALAAWPEEMPSLARYEAMLDRGFHRALRELERRRMPRRGRPVIPQAIAADEPVFPPREWGQDGAEPPAIAPDAAAEPASSDEEEGSSTKRSQFPIPSRRDCMEPMAEMPPLAGASTDFTKRSQFADLLAAALSE